MPEVEFGKLVDDIGVKAVLLTDVMDSEKAVTTELTAELTDDERAERCLTGARQMAKHLNAALGRQTSSVFSFPLEGLPAADASYGCSLAPKYGPDISVSWEGSPRSPSETADAIAKGGAFLTGADKSEVRSELASCIADAIRPDANDLAGHEFRGVKIECHAFAWGGGGGSAMVYRRFGAGPVHAALTEAEIAELSRVSRRRALEARESEDQSGRGKLAEMVALVRVASDACPAADGAQEVLMLYLAAAANDNAPGEDEIKAKQDYLAEFRELKGYVKFCQLYAIEMTQAKIIVGAMKLRGGN